ncbi:MAG: hypothetical protein WKG07_18330 [Hymenobacter sp.]
MPASTIHKKIYRQTSGAPAERLNFQRQPNRAEQMLYIVDEASHDFRRESLLGENGLLDDLMGFVFEKQHQPAAAHWRHGAAAAGGPAAEPGPRPRAAGLPLPGAGGRRGAAPGDAPGPGVGHPGECHGAARGAAPGERPNIQLHTKGFHDMFTMGGDKLEDGLRWAYRQFGHENTTIICRSNRNANQYNQLIRRSLVRAPRRRLRAATT